MADYSAEFNSTHKCQICKYQGKCLRHSTIHEALFNVTANALERWNIDVDITYLVQSCERFVPDFDMIEALNLLEYEEGDEDE